MRLDWDRYLEHVSNDGRRLVEAGLAHLEADVPWCPGWVGRDVVAHTGLVHRRVAWVVRELPTERPESGEAKAPDSGLEEWYREGLDSLLAVMADTHPDTPVYSWYEPDRTVGFWIRRMAHETAIHRIDAESAAGAYTPLDPALAADGVAELLGPIFCAYTDDPKWEFAPDGRVAEIRAGDTGDTMHLILGEGKHGPGWLFADGAGPDPATVISAGASDLDRWAWGRADPEVLTIEGDVEIATAIRSLAAEVTG